MEINLMNSKLINMGTINKNKVVLNLNSKGTITLYYSYETLISFSFQYPKGYLEGTIKNLWSTTTGKFLNEIEPNKDKRLSQEDFNLKLNEVMKLIYLK